MVRVMVVVEGGVIQNIFTVGAAHVMVIDRDDLADDPVRVYNEPTTSVTEERFLEILAEARADAEVEARARALLRAGYRTMAGNGGHGL
jgi:hypothetical protein